ncbi:MAG: hypothetical protein ACHQDB_06385 [Steroidobacterales bacterium]
MIRTAFIHEVSKFKKNRATDRRVVEARTGLLTPGRLAIEEDVVASGCGSIARVASEQAADSVAARGVRVSLVRLPPSVRGEVSISAAAGRGLTSAVPTGSVS